MKLTESARALLQQIEEQERTCRPEGVRLTERAQFLFRACHQVGQSWSGSAFGYHWNLYYEDFEELPLGNRFSVEWGGIHGLPHGWRPRNPEDVRARIQDLAGFDPVALEGELGNFVRGPKHLLNELLIALAPLHDLPTLSAEKKLLDRLEQWDWRDDAGNKCVASDVNAFPHGTRDSAAFMEGFRLPTHTHYAGDAAQAKGYVEAVDEFWDLSKRLLKQLADAEERIAAAEKANKHPEATPDDLRRYERLKRANLVVFSFVISYAVYFAAMYLLQRYSWVVALAPSNGFKILAFLTVFFLLAGLFVRPFRSWCWGAAALSTLVSIIQAIR